MSRNQTHTMKTRIRPNHVTKDTARTKTTRGIQPTLDEIQQRAHEIFRARGGTPGKELEDWLRAEQQLKCERAAANLAVAE